MKVKSIQEIKKVPKFSEIKTNFPLFDLPAPDDTFDILNIIDLEFYPKNNIIEDEMNENGLFVEYRENYSDNNPRL